MSGEAAAASGSVAAPTIVLATKNRSSDVSNVAEATSTSTVVLGATGPVMPLSITAPARFYRPRETVNVTAPAAAIIYSLDAGLVKTPVVVGTTAPVTAAIVASFPTVALVTADIVATPSTVAPVTADIVATPPTVAPVTADIVATPSTVSPATVAVAKQM